MLHGVSLVWAVRLRVAGAQQDSDGIFGSHRCGISMVENLKPLICDFAFALGATLSAPISHELQSATHQAHRLPEGKCAVYVFSLSENYGKRVPAGGNRTLKVGKVGCKSNARFQSQHYNPLSAKSNLARTLLETKILWPYLGIVEMYKSNVRRWIEETTDRDNFYLSAEDASHLSQLETYLKGRLGPVFEGG